MGVAEADAVAEFDAVEAVAADAAGAGEAVLGYVVGAASEVRIRFGEHWALALSETQYGQALR